MSAKLVRRFFGVLVIIAVLVAFSLFILTETKSPTKELEEFLHGSQEIEICKLEIDIGYGPDLQRVDITNQGDLDFISMAFRKAVTNESGGGKLYGATIYFADNRRVRTEMVIRDDVEYLVVDVPTFMSISDPVGFRVLLAPSLPTGLSNTLHSIVIK